VVAKDAGGSAVAARAATWVSSDTTVVRVNPRGVATAWAPGRATVTAGVDGHSVAATGIREFTVGTGGSALDELGAIGANSEVRNNSARGVLKLTLWPSSYEWTFVPDPGQTFSDSGAAACHGPPGR